MTINILADRYAAAKAVLDEAEAAVKAIKEEILALGAEEIEGRNCFVKVGLSERATLDKKAVERELGADWVVEHSKVTLVTSVRIAAKPVKKLVAEAHAEIAA